MKEIKFRGKRIDNGEWVYGMLRRGNGAESSFRFIEVGGIPGHTYRVIPETVGQFIERHDKNGNEIYEGDRINGYCNTGVVIWCGRSAMFNVSDFYNSSFDFQTCAFSEGNEFEIIGNIYEKQEQE